MAIPKNLPIFRDMMRLTDMLLDDMENIARKYRRTLGDRILDTTFVCFRCLQYAYDSQGDVRHGHLVRFSSEFDTLRVYLRIVTERRMLSLGALTRIAMLVEDIAKQLYGWTERTKVKQ